MKVFLKMTVWTLAIGLMWKLTAWDAGWRGIWTGEYYQFAGTIGDRSQWWNMLAMFYLLPLTYAATVALCRLIDRRLEPRPDMSRVHYLW